MLFFISKNKNTHRDIPNISVSITKPIIKPLRVNGQLWVSMPKAGFCLMQLTKNLNT